MTRSSPWQVLIRRARPVRETVMRLVHPLTEALVTGSPDPARPRSRRLRRRTPQALGLLPFRAIDLVLVGDLLLALLLFGTGLASLQDAAAEAHSLLDPQGIFFAALAFSLPLALRDRWPLAAWRSAVLLIPLGTVVSRQLLDGLPYTAATAITYVLVVYTVAVRSERHITVGAWVVSVLGAWMLHSDSMAVATGIVTVTVLFGHNVRARRLAIGLLIQEERRSERALAGQAVLEERARIARELHDVVAHHMSVIAIQAEAVPLRAAGDATRLEEGLGEIRALSLAAMTEMRRVLGVLRDGDGRTDTAPQPGLGRLEELIGTARSAGLTVTLKLGGDLTGLPEAVSLSAYRIAQESLSNAMRHAPGSTVSVKITRSGTELHLRVANDARHPSPTEPGHIGHGLIGMRERVSMLGGSLWAGPVGPGFAVTAILPIMEKA
ncbi:sensor histidine kinase [Streptosporangium sp. 'caverna']|uniref:sensor histidine kinase n=1 Tax=Streptosporangium sp. 'caverna' TaxID=2202249 RepID=UPI000D7D9FDE|nr:sensor histidine kinase [Streptosporangium sp. 'caverna']AWS44825.1 sensor histidine kinase [Streptosporangium sp. 'caverna']